MQSIPALLQALPEQDGALLFCPETRQYLTGFAASDGAVLLSHSGNVFFTDSRYLEAAQARVTTMHVTDIQQMPQWIKQQKLQSIALEAQHITVAHLQRLQERYPDIRFSADGTLDTALQAQRMEKSDWEIAQIQAAQRIAEHAFADLLPQCRPGISELELAARLEFYMRMHGADAIAFDTIIVSGSNSSMPHGVPTEKKLEPGDFVTMDFGAVKNGYHSDMTRTIAIGQVTQKQKEVYEIVRTAQEKVLAALRPGLSCQEADAAARGHIAAHGYAAAFGHSTGHGVGLQIHEAPAVAPNSKHILQPGNVVTVEPGIYLPGEFGVRIEDMAVITPQGCRNLTRTPKALLVL